MKRELAKPPESIPAPRRYEAVATGRTVTPLVRPNRNMRKRMFSESMKPHSRTCVNVARRRCLPKPACKYSLRATRSSLARENWHAPQQRDATTKPPPK
eukprot:scaffold124720_cov69-Phaeocystis_antarctica.AAC.4